MTGTDLSLIAEEMKKAQEILKKIQEMKSGVIAMGDKRIAVQTSVSSTMSAVSIMFLNFLWFLEEKFPDNNTRVAWRGNL